MAWALLQEDILFYNPFPVATRLGAQTLSVDLFGGKDTRGLSTVPCHRGDKVLSLQETHSPPPHLGRMKSAGTQTGEFLASQNLLLMFLPMSPSSSGGNTTPLDPELRGASVGFTVTGGTGSQPRASRSRVDCP